MRQLALIALLLLLVGCQRSTVAWIPAADDWSGQCGDRVAAMTREDSAGVVIVRHREPTAPPFDLAAPVTVIRAGDSAGTEPFTRPLAAVTATGRVVVTDSFSARVLLFDEHGRLLRQLGQPGEGPGDVRRPSRVWTHARDSVIVADRKGNRLTVLDADGELVGITMVFGMPWDQDAKAPEREVPGVTSVLGRLPDGAWLAMQRTLRPIFPGDLRDGELTRWPLRGWLLRIPAAGGLPTRLRELDLGGQVVQAEGDGLSMYPLLFAPSATVAPAADGYWLATGRSYRVDRVGADGATQLSVRLCRAPRALAEVDVAAAWSRHAATAAGDVGTMPRALPVPQHAPGWRVVTHVASATLWLEDVDHRTGEAVWWVLGRDGALRGRVRVPAGRELQGVGVDRLVAIAHTMDDGQQVEVYTIPEQLRGIDTITGDR